MMDSTVFIIVSLVVTFIAYFIKGIAGFGPSLIVIPVFSLFIDIKDAVIIAALADVLSSFVLVVRGYQTIKWKIFKRVGIGLLTGTIIGVSLFKVSNTDLLKKILGIFILIYIFLPFITKKLSKKKFKKQSGVIFGFVGGICGGMINTNGPPVVIYISRIIKDRIYIRSTLAALFLVDSIWRVSLFALNDLITTGVVQFFFSRIVPTLLLGMFISFNFDEKFGSKVFSTIIRSVLLVSGLNLLVF